MSGVNKVILIGRLSKDFELKYSANGNAIANLNLVTSEEWKDKQSGEKQEKPEFHRVVIFGKPAEIAGQYLTKGSQIYIEGKLKTRKWTDNNTGKDRYATEVVVDGFGGQMQMLGGGQNNGQQSQPNQNQQGFNGGQTQVQPQQQPPQQPYGQGVGVGHQCTQQFQQPNGFDDEVVPF